jgi:hypothetical protein
MNCLAPLLLLTLAGCAATNANCTDLRQGACKITSMRLFLDTGFGMTGPDGLSVNLSSNPNEMATAEAFAAINRLAGLVAARQPAPLVQPQSFIPGPDSNMDEPGRMAWRGSQRRAVTPITGSVAALAPAYPGTDHGLSRACPAILTPSRVTAGTPWMVEGLAMAPDI